MAKNKKPRVYHKVRGIRLSDSLYEALNKDKNAAQGKYHKTKTWEVYLARLLYIKTVVTNHAKKNKLP